MTRAAKTRRSLPVLPSAPAIPEGAAAVAPFASLQGVRVGLITLGCDKNTVDSERMLAGLIGSGADVSGDAEDAEVVVINTCGFIDIAKEESIETILEAVRLKGEGRVRAVVAMGCLVQRYKDELVQELPEVDLFLGLTEADRLVPELQSRGLLPTDAVPTMERPLRALSTDSPHTSYLKISEGCDHTCAFCAIPLMRGKHRSTPIARLVAEAQELENRGVVELNVISQDTTWYGRDLLRSGGAGDAGDFFVGREFETMAGPRLVGASLPPAGGPPTSNLLAGAGQIHSGSRRPPGDARHGLLPELLEALTTETSIPWLRLFYMYPSGIYPELVERIAREPRILPYLDMPIQHGVDSVLTRMRRPERQATIRERVLWLRDAIPDLVLRTTIIVGFPGETDEAFEELLEFLEEIRFDRLGAFSYSPEENTRAVDMDGQVPEELRRERLERLFDLQRGISLEKNEAMIGAETTVLVDRAERATGDEPAVGRTVGQAYEVDGNVHLESASHVRAGEFVRVRITDAGEHDLTGMVLGEG